MRNYFLHFISVSLPICFVAFLFAWWAEPIYGDLTRIGKWTERDFGPNVMQSPATVKSSGRALLHSDVMVLGDSFSQENLWQSIVSDKTGYTVQTFDYGKNCVSNFIGAAIANPFSKIIVIETVERSLIGRFGIIKSCAKMKAIPSEIKESKRESIRPTTWPLTFDFSYLWDATQNTVKLNLYPEQIVKKFRTVNIPLQANCAKFSNRKNDRLLYYADDDLKRQWSSKDISDTASNILKIQKEIESHGKKMLFIIAPDKSSVYQSCLVEPITKTNGININDQLISLGVSAPNMTTLFRGEINNIQDLYNPDNTHWSVAGYVLAGEAISQFILSKFSEK